MRKRSALLTLVLLAACAACSACTGQFDHLTEAPAVPPSPEECGTCHVAIYEEFTGSAHARSWTRPAFEDATAGYSFKDCLGCHAPESIFVDGPPRKRAGAPEHGVTCVSCHFDEGTMVGPVEVSALAQPHPVQVRRDDYLRADLCGKCHEGTFEEWTASTAPDKRTCQDCHMERVTRTVTQATDALSSVLVAFEDEVEGRRHTFHVGALPDVADAVDSEVRDVRRQGDRVRFDVVVTNRLPHLIPTGEFGRRWVRVTVEGLDAGGETCDFEEFRLLKPRGDALVPGEPRAFPVELPASCMSVRVTVSTGKGDGERTPFHVREWRLP